MLSISIAKIDAMGHKSIAKVTIIRGQPHQKIKQANYYYYRGKIDGQNVMGKVVHTPAKGAAALARKVLKKVQVVEL